MGVHPFFVFSRGLVEAEQVNPLFVSSGWLVEAELAPRHQHWYQLPNWLKAMDHLSGNT
jgi:hypothetical protein